MSQGKWYVGCACDSSFAQHTAVMLTSLAINGDVKDAVIIVASFGLTEDDKNLIMQHAGSAISDIRFIDIDDTYLSSLGGKTWDQHYPPAVLGRLFIPSAINEPGARLLTLDSDMIVNTSVRPLFDLVFDEGYIAAIHDTPRVDDLSYFNSGMMLIDVDTYKNYNVTERCLKWLVDSKETPRWPDQDALNTIVGHKWHRLERKWNWAYCGPQFGDKQLSLSEYEEAYIAHFTGQSKPWSNDSHPGRALYIRYQKALIANGYARDAYKAHVDDNFTATAIEVFLGRMASGAADIRRFRSSDSISTLANVLRSTEFVEKTLIPIRNHTDLIESYVDFNIRHACWSSERLPLAQASAEKAAVAISRRDLLKIVISDDVFCRSTGIDNIVLLLK